MDGTLLNSNNEVSKRTREAIIKAREKNVHIILATGRLVTSAMKYSSIIDIKSPIISSNGAVIVDSNKEIIFEKHINEDLVESIADIGEKSGLYYHFYTEDSFYSNQYDEEIIDFYNPKGIKEEEKVEFNLYKDIKDVLDKNIKIYKFIFIDNDPKKLYKLREELESIKNINICSSSKNNIEVMSQEVSKGDSLSTLCKMLKISRKEVIAIGDNENDLSMIEFAGLGVAMGNGTQKIKELADIITCNNDEDGVAKIIEKYIL